MKYPKAKFRASNSQSYQNHSLSSTAVTNLSVTTDSSNDSCQKSGLKKTDDPVNEQPEDDHVEGLKFLAKRDMRSLYKHIPALNRRDVQMSGILQHFYPEGGWGWVVVFCSFLAQCLTTGLLLSGGVLSVEMVIHFHQSNHMETTWVVVTAWSISLALSPIITHVCHKYSIRLVAVVGGLIMNLAFLFASFGHQLHQVFLSYGLLFAVGCCAVREASSLMVGQYFKERRELAEMFVLTGPGIGMIVFSILYKESIGSLGWRLGLHSMQGLTILAFFLGLFFRSASMYHPQRDAISHIKHQKEKVKGINSKENLKKKREKPMFDLSFLKNRNICLFLMCSSISSLGIYTPLFYIYFHMYQEDKGDTSANLSLLQLWLGLATCCGCLLAAAATIVKSRAFYFSKRILLQFSQFGVAFSMVCLYFVSGFYGYAMCAWIYGLFFGCFLYSSKIFCYNIVKTKQFSRTWSIVQASQSLPIMAGITITGYMNQDYDKTGYWFSLFFVILGSCLLSLLNVEDCDAVLHIVQVKDLENDKDHLIGGTLMEKMDLNGDVKNILSRNDDLFHKRSDVNGNSQYPTCNLPCMRRLSHSDPEIITSPHSLHLLNRQATWHTLRYTNNTPPDMMVIDQITSTV